MNQNQAEHKVVIASITYNQEKYIAETLESFVNQKTEFPFQVIIADDCSTDGTKDIIQQYAEKYPEIINPIYRSPNLGATQNFVKTLSEIKAEYVIFCEGDDYFSHPYKLQKQVDFLENNPQMAVCFHPVRIFYEDDPEKIEIFPLPEYRFNKSILDINDLLQRNFIQTNSAMYRWRFLDGENIEEIFPTEILPGDWFLHLLHAEKGQIGYIDEVMAVYRKHQGGIWWNAHNSKEHDKKYGVEKLNFWVRVQKVFADYQVDHIESSIRYQVEWLVKLYLKTQDFSRLEKVAKLAPTAYEEATKTFFIQQHENGNGNFPIESAKKKKVMLFGIPIISIRTYRGKERIKILGIPIFKIKSN